MAPLRAPSQDRMRAPSLTVPMPCKMCQGDHIFARQLTTQKPLLISINPIRTKCLAPLFQWISLVTWQCGSELIVVEASNQISIPLWMSSHAWGISHTIGYTVNSISCSVTSSFLERMRESKEVVTAYCVLRTRTNASGNRKCCWLLRKNMKGQPRKS
jgi:hypothetical protein